MIYKHGYIQTYRRKENMFKIYTEYTEFFNTHTNTQ